MEKKPRLFYKMLVVGVIVLFIGVGVQPAFADVSFEPDNSELVEITVQFYETDRTYNHTVLLTQEKAEELDNLINDFEIKLENADNKIETEAIYKDTIVSLNNLGLLPKDISIEKAQRLVTGKEQDPRFVRIFKRLYDRYKGSWETDENFLCLISGSTNHTSFIGPIGCLTFSIIEKLSYFFDNFPFIYEYIFWPILGIFLIPFGFFGGYIWLLNPLPLGYQIGFAEQFINNYGQLDYWPAIGTVHTNGLNGEKIWNGSFYGRLPILESLNFFIGVFGFTGIKIFENYSYTYLGSALWVKIRNTW